MKRIPRTVSRLLLPGSLLLLTAGGGFLFLRWAFPPHNTIQQLQGLPVHSVARLLGVVTYADGPGHRFWMQDETGAVAIPLDPRRFHVHAGEIVAVTAAKTSPYDPTQGFAGIGLRPIQVHSSSAHVRLPAPFPISLNNFPNPRKNGLCVEFTAVVRAVTRDTLGRAVLYLAGSGPEVPATVAHPSPHDSSLVNARVRVIAVPEEKRDRQGTVISRALWINSGRGIHVLHPAPATSPLYSIRTLYGNPKAVNGHRIRVRGIVAAASATSVLLRDDWGAIECSFDRPHAFSVGSTIEVAGFPSLNGLAINLFHAAGHAVPARLVDTAAVRHSHLPIFRTVSSIRRLSPEKAAQALPVRIHGVVTYDDPIWRQLYVQDATAGIFVKYSGRPHLPAGTRVTVSGLTGPGNFAPVIRAASFHPEGRAPLPRPRPVLSTAAASGALDSQYATIDGIVHTMQVGSEDLHPVLSFQLHTEIGQIHVFTSPGFPGPRQSRRFEDASVRIRGVFGTVYNSRRQLIGYQLLVASPSQIHILVPAVPHPFRMRTTPIGSLLRFSPHSHFGHRVKVTGAVTLVSPGFLYLQDSTGGVEAWGDTRSIHVGDMIAAVGYPTLTGHYSPVLTDAVFRSLRRSKTVAPQQTTPEAILDGHSDSRLVTVQGRLLTSLIGPSRATLVLQSGVHTFGARLDTDNIGLGFDRLRRGSVLRLTGVASAQVDPSKLYRLLQENPDSFHILLRSPSDIAVIRPAPFWSRGRTLALLVLLVILTIATLAWVGALRRRVRRQTAALLRASETSQAVRDLADAMQDLSANQHVETPVSVRGAEEIAQLVIGFNNMLSELRSRDLARREAEARLQHMAVIDELTGLPNRRLLTERLSHALAQARRDNRRLALLYIDLDGFKLVNDSLGHAIGDRLLTEVAARLRSRARESDTLARIGGDEFILMLDGIHTEDDAESAARGLLDALASPFLIDGHPIRIGASIGISLFPQHGIEGGELLQQADCAMYAAKRNGKNRIVQFGDDLGSAAHQRLTLESELRQAIVDQAIHLHYQPEFDLASGAVVRFEALARWNHPALGDVPPLHFIPIAEETGLIVPLGAFLLEHACREALRWQTAADRPVQVAVNVSSVQFARDSFPDDVADILHRTGLDPRLLQIELTESATLHGVERAAALIDRLHAIGVTIALDDFGTGYSSLSYLSHLPFDALKIDRSFVAELMVRPETRAFVQSILTMAHNLNMRVIVEGIETAEQLRSVRRLGANEAQGFLLGRPSPTPLEILSSSQPALAPALP